MYSAQLTMLRDRVLLSARSLLVAPAAQPANIAAPNAPLAARKDRLEERRWITRPSPTSTH